MSAKTIRSALGQLQDDPENVEALADLRTALGWDLSLIHISEPTRPY